VPTYFTRGDGPFVVANQTAGASLTIHSQSVPAAEITRLLGVDPDRTWRRGDRMGRSASSQHRYLTHGWTVSSGIGEEASVNRHLAALMDRLAPAADELPTLLREQGVNAKLWLVEHIENWNPGLSLSPSELAAVAHLGVELAVDIYVYEPGELGPVRIRGRASPPDAGA
jgi:hypothetical protein